MSKPVAATMRAAVVTGPGELEVRSVALPEPGPRQVRIRLQGCGVCGSNLALWEGRPWFEYPPDPGAPGHEGWGIVEKLGEGVAPELLGQRVAALSYRAFAEYDLTRLFALPFARNIGSRRVLEKAGYVLEAILRSSAIKEGEVLDQAQYARWAD